MVPICYETAVAAMPFFKFAVCLQNRNYNCKELQGDIIIILIHPWFQACISWKKVCYMMILFPVIYLFYDGVIISREHLKWSISQRHCVYFTTLDAAIHHNKWSVVDSRKTEGYVYLRKTTVALWICNHRMNLLILFLKNQKMDSMGMPCSMENI